eukprot:TRINITY_DN27807_c0_g1_i2.p3 TRINITY_DN27807_c0_g1~~TRINITY_DN27807_c0_g1_i2.p3  ORF type:complete len:127 (-),score=19.11 TRINITY_DN27807_c0_g1_i2:515-895(-)
MVSRVCVSPPFQNQNFLSTSIKSSQTRIMTDTKREAFRRYLESAGVVDALTKVLVSLYEEVERPKNAVEYIKTLLGGPTSEEFNSLKAEKDALSSEVEELRKHIEEQNSKIYALEHPEEQVATEEQ